MGLHYKMRTDIWGYAPDEKIDIDDMLKVKYAGIRPAPGYPTQPDHTEKAFMWKLLSATDKSGIMLTDSLAMLPAASVCALVFANDCSTYFQVGKICKDQVVDYAAAATTTAATTACAVVGSRCVVLIENVGFPSFDGGHIAHAEVHTNEVLMKGHAHNSSSEFNGLLVALRACPNPLFVL